jgi:hypothetical protein
MMSLSASSKKHAKKHVAGGRNTIPVYRPTSSSAAAAAALATTATGGPSSSSSLTRSGRDALGYKIIPSNIVGKRIVYADTGIETPHLVGSAEEAIYFKVQWTAPRLEKEERMKGRNPTGKNESSSVSRKQLFYDGPRHYCLHYLLCLSRPSYRQLRMYEDQEYLETNVERMMVQMQPMISAWEQRVAKYMQEQSKQSKQSNGTGHIETSESE